MFTVSQLCEIFGSPVDYKATRNSNDIYSYFLSQLQEMQDELHCNGECIERTYICQDLSHLTESELNEKIAADIANVVTSIKCECKVTLDENEVTITTS